MSDSPRRQRSGNPESSPAADDLANLEIPADGMRAMGAATLERVIAHLASLGAQPSCGDVDAAAICRTMREPAPEEGTPLEALLEPLFEEWIPRSYTTAGPGYLAYIPGGGLYPAALADLISDTTNRYTGLWAPSPALVQLEGNVLEWFRDWMGFPPEARGLLTTGGSMAGFNAILAARERHLGTDVRSGTIYVSSQVHHSLAKAARMAGIFADRVRSVAVDGEFRMRVDALEAAIADDRGRGLRPFFVVSTAGTTNTGAVDPIDAIADVCERQKLWHHVDGAYGAFFHLCPELQPLLRGLPRGDSLTLDPHKGLFLPYGTGALLVRDGAALRAAHQMRAGYLPDAADPDEFYDPGQHGPELSRGFPGLRLWLCLKFYGVARFRAALAEKRALALDAAARIAALPGIAMVAPPQLSLFAFHLTWPGSTLAAENAATIELVERVTRRGRVMITGCMIEEGGGSGGRAESGGRFLARVCVLSFRTRQDRIDACVEDVEAELKAILGAARLD